MTNREEIERRRTFAIISHPDAGKTTLTEKLLLYGGAINQAGSVKGKQSAKHAVSDWMDIEKQRGISVTSSVLQFNYAGKCVNILDTPGHQDFSEDTYRTLMAADSAVMVIDAAKGVEAQTIKLFKVCTLRHIPIFTFINKMDREARDPFELMENIEEILGIKTYPMNWPIGCGKEFKGVFDRNTRKVLAFSSDGRANGVKKVNETEAELGDAALDEPLMPEQMRIKAMRSRWALFMLAWILKMKAENSSRQGWREEGQRDRGRTGRCRTGRAADPLPAPAAGGRDRAAGRRCRGI